MTRPFEGIRVIDVTHVLAGPFATYQCAVLGADVIKVEHPDEPDQSRANGTDKALNRRNMGTSFLTQASNKRAITLDLKTPADRDILKKLVATADIFVENYRPGAFEVDLGPLQNWLPFNEQQHNIYGVVDFKIGRFDVNAGVGYGLTPGSDRLMYKMIIGTDLTEGASDKSSEGSKMLRKPESRLSGFFRP
jgi:hypothetical protein